jgi:sporulation integral membrane protein YtvI
VLAGTVTLLAIYLALRYVVPEIFSWLKYFLVVLFPFLLAAIFSVFMEPLVVYFSRGNRVSRLIAVPLAMLVFFGGIGTVLTLLILRLVKELNDLYLVLPEKITTIENLFNTWVEKGVLFYGTLPKGITSNLQDTINGLTITAQHLVRDLLSVLVHFVSMVPGAIMVIIISLVTTYFFSKDRNKIANMWLRLVPPPWGKRTMEISKQVAVAFQSYVRAQFILISITTLISIVGLHIIGTDYALTLGLLVGIFDMIPVLGPGTIYIPWAAWAFITTDIVLGLKLTVLYLLVMVVRAVMEAKVVAVNLGLHPLAVLMAMYIGLKTIGVLGLVLGPIMVVAVQATVKAVQSVHK